ncbi:hypothetical protein METP1_03564 [Methanosarcinales archaeon]|nr:hypothetical protein METP1_03564 [Methanosarcinales archaeon]
MKVCIPIIRHDGLNNMVTQDFGMRMPSENTEENNT